MTDYTPDTIRAIRRALGETQIRFALRLGVDTSAVSTWERGLHSPAPRAKEKLDEAAALAESKAMFIGDKERHK